MTMFNTPAHQIAERIREIAVERAESYDVRDRFDAEAVRVLRNVVAFAVTSHVVAVTTTWRNAATALDLEGTCLIDLAAEALGIDGEISSPAPNHLTFTIFR